MNIKEIIVYHGTTKNNANIIYSTKYFKNSIGNNEYMGNGIYFYDNHINALHMCIGKYIKAYKTIPTYKKLSEEYAIVSAVLKVNDNEILDMNSYAVKLKLYYLYKKIKDSMINVNDKQMNDGFYLNFISKNFPDFLKNYKVLKNTYNKEIISQKLRKTKKVKSRIIYDIKQVYYNVIDSSCIFNINICENNYEDEYNIIENLYI